MAYSLPYVVKLTPRDQNQVLFYRLMQDHLKELLGVLYTPGAAQAVAQYSNLFRRPIGCFLVSLSYPGLMSS